MGLRHRSKGRGPQQKHSLGEQKRVEKKTMTRIVMVFGVSSGSGGVIATGSAIGSSHDPVKSPRKHILPKRRAYSYIMRPDRTDFFFNLRTQRRDGSCAEPTS